MNGEVLAGRHRTGEWTVEGPVHVVKERVANGESRFVNYSVVAADKLGVVQRGVPALGHLDANISMAQDDVMQLHPACGVGGVIQREIMVPVSVVRGVMNGAAHLLPINVIILAAKNRRMERVSSADHRPFEEQPGMAGRGRIGEFDGSGLTLNWNDRDRRLQLLEIAHGGRLMIKNPAKMSTPWSDISPSDRVFSCTPRTTRGTSPKPTVPMTGRPWAHLAL